MACRTQDIDALVRMFEQALKLSVTLPIRQCDTLLNRPDAVRTISHKCGCGVGDNMDHLLTEYGER